MGKRLWMSEYGTGASPPLEMGGALALSATILADLNVLHASGWCYWYVTSFHAVGHPFLRLPEYLPGCWHICYWGSCLETTTAAAFSEAEAHFRVVIVTSTH